MGKRADVYEAICKSLSLHVTHPLISRTPRLKRKVLQKDANLNRPTTYNDPSTGLPTLGTQTCLWFLISRPMLSLSPTETNTARSPLSSKWANLPLNLSSKPPSTIRPPPDFPMPIPASYVVLACPAQNVTAYPNCKDDSAPPDPEPPRGGYRNSMAPPCLSSALNLGSGGNVNSNERYGKASTSSFNPYIRGHTRQRSSTSSAPSPPKRIHKCKRLRFLLPRGPYLRVLAIEQQRFRCSLARSSFTVLSIDGIGGWYPSDAVSTCSEAEWQRRCC